MARLQETDVAAPTRTWLECMADGDFDAAWRISDRLLHERTGQTCHDWPRHLQFVWDGTPLAGRRVLILCYRGLGDIVQFARYVPLVRAIASEVTLWAPSALLPLLRTIDGIDRVLPLHDGAPDVSYDVDVELMELPHVFRTTLATIPARVPYLHVAPAPLEKNAGQLAVGLVWQAGDWDERRNVPMRDLAPLATLPNVQLHLLQRGEGRREWRYGGVVDSGSDDPLRAAAVMRALDLVVTVDSFPAHLAGALGVPVWTLLHAEPDWRWLRARDDSPWYPTMRLFRQTRAGDWSSVVLRVAEELSELSAALAAEE